MSATSRSIIDTLRTLFVWLVSLGLGWERFNWLQVVGTFTYLPFTNHRIWHFGLGNVYEFAVRVNVALDVYFSTSFANEKVRSNYNRNDAVLFDLNTYIIYVSRFHILTLPDSSVFLVSTYNAD